MDSQGSMVMAKEQLQAETLQHMVDGLITLDEGCERYLKHGGQPEAFIAFAVKHKSEIFCGNPITGKEWPWPKDLSEHVQKCADRIRTRDTKRMKR
jgi:hypothetical protein